MNGGITSDGISGYPKSFCKIQCKDQILFEHLVYFIAGFGEGLKFVTGTNQLFEEKFSHKDGYIVLFTHHTPDIWGSMQKFLVNQTKPLDPKDTWIMTTYNDYEQMQHSENV